MTSPRSTLTPRRIAEFCDLRLALVLEPMEVERRIARRYRLPDGYFVGKMGGADRAPGDFRLDDATPAERRRLAWHLPEDFNRRPRSEQAEILDWVRNVIISGSTDYRRYQTAMMRQRYAVRFACASGPRRKSSIATAEGETILT